MATDTDISPIHRAKEQRFIDEANSPVRTARYILWGAAALVLLITILVNWF